MKNSLNLLSNNELNDLKNLIEDIEEKTELELVVAIATESGRYDRSESIWGLTFSLTSLIYAEKVSLLIKDYTWGDHSAYILASSILVVVGFIIGSLLASYIHPLRDIFISQNEKDEQVQISSLALLGDIKSKTNSPVALIYISLAERKVIIQGDQTFLNKVDKKDILEIRDIILENFKQKNYGLGLTSAIQAKGEVLKSLFPINSKNKDDVENHIRLIHPRI